MGMVSGAALTGLRPVAELMFVDFMGVCFDQILNQTAKFRYMFGGKAVTPLTIRPMYGGGLRVLASTVNVYTLCLPMCLVLKL